VTGDRLAVSKAEAAELLGVSERLVEKLIGSRSFPVLRLGDRVVVPVRALEEWSTRAALASLENEDDRPRHPRPVVEEERGSSTRRPRAV
jgi:excisionase family DNA binding protein